MKTRMIWRYTFNGFWGTCSKWAAEHASNVHPVERERVMWIGKTPICWSCENGWH